MNRKVYPLVLWSMIRGQGLDELRTESGLTDRQLRKYIRGWEARDYVRVERSPGDSRRRTVHRTPEGDARIAQEQADPRMARRELDRMAVRNALRKAPNQPSPPVEHDWKLYGPDELDFRSTYMWMPKRQRKYWEAQGVRFVAGQFPILPPRWRSAWEEGKIGWCRGCDRKTYPGLHRNEFGECHVVAPTANLPWRTASRRSSPHSGARAETVRR